MGTIINLTQHYGTPEQGVVEPYDKNLVQRLLTFESIPTKELMEIRAIKLTNIASVANADKAMIGGAPYFMSTLEKFLKNRGITPVYAFSVRQSEDVPQEDGSVKKVTTFKHLGFVEM